jgi:hypothetical protein
MRRDHEVALTAALDQLYLQGSAAIIWEHVYLWYNVDEIRKSDYDDIIARWQVLCEGYGHSEDDIPELETIQKGKAKDEGKDETWLLLCRVLFKKDEKRIPLADRT